MSDTLHFLLGPRRREKWGQAGKVNCSSSFQQFSSLQGKLIISYEAFFSEYQAGTSLFKYQIGNKHIPEPPDVNDLEIVFSF